MDNLDSLFKATVGASIDLDAVLSILGQELHHYACVLAGSRDAGEDALQDTLVALLQEGPRAAQIQTPRAWVFTVLRRKALAYRKHEPQPQAMSLAHEFSESVDTDQNSRLMLEEALCKLDALDQEIILLHLWEGLTFEGIADVLVIPRNTLLSRYARAIRRLRLFFDLPEQMKKRQEVRY